MAWRENKGVANLDGIYTDGLGCASARNLWRKSLIKIWPAARNNYGSTEHTEGTDG